MDNTQTPTTSTVGSEKYIENYVWRALTQSILVKEEFWNGFKSITCTNTEFTIGRRWYCLVQSFHHKLHRNYASYGEENTHSTTDSLRWIKWMCWKVILVLRNITHNILILYSWYSTDSVAIDYHAQMFNPSAGNRDTAFCVCSPPKTAQYCAVSAKENT